MGELTHIVSGDVAQFRSADKSNIKSMKVSLIADQKGSGDPTPNNVRALCGFSFIRLTHSKKNLWNDSWFKDAGWTLKTSGNFEGYYNGNARSLFLYQYGTGGMGIFHKYMNLGRVRISFDAIRPGSSGTIRIYFMYEGDTAWTNHSGNITSSGHKSFVSAANKNCIGVSFYTNVGVSSDAWGIKNVQIEISNAETAYEIAGGDEYYIPLPALGKNLFDSNNERMVYDQYVNSNGTFSISDSYKVSFLTPIQPSTTYVLQANKISEDGLGMNVATYDENKTFIERPVVISGTSVSGETGVIYAPFTTSADARFMRVSMPLPSVVIQSQIELGDTRTDYEPAKTFCGGYVDLVTGAIRSTHKIITLDGVTSGLKMETKGSATAYDEFYFPLSNGSLYGTAKSNRATQAKAEQYGYKCSHGLYYDYRTDDAEYSIINTRGFAVSIYIGSSSVMQPRLCFALGKGVDTVEKCNAWLKAQYDIGKPVQLWYALKTAQTYQIDPTPFKAFLDYNSLWSNAGSVEVEYAFTDRLLKKRILLQKPPLRLVQLASLNASDWLKSRANIAFNGNEITVTNTSGNSLKAVQVNVPVGHKYLVRGSIRKESSTGAMIGMYGSTASSTNYNDRIVFSRNTEEDVYYNVFLESTSTYYGCRIAHTTSSVFDDYSYHVNHEIIDLTASFGAGNEPTTLAGFEALCIENGVNPNAFHPYYNQA